jgi:tetratricopeptide (TPR) repeat protein
MKKLISISLLALAILAIMLFDACSIKNMSDTIVREAFNIRMNGNSDKAKLILEDYLQNDSANALANYEMARLSHYMLLGGSQVEIEAISQSINKAVEADPENVIYVYYKGIVSFLNAFMSMQMGNPQVKEIVAATCAQFERVLELKPDYHEARMYLVEIYGLLPKDMGGDSLKAAQHIAKLASMDNYFGAKAKTVVVPEEFNLLEYWENLLASDSNHTGYLTEAGKASLFIDDPAKAEEYFNRVMAVDPEKNILLLDLARYHLYKVMQNGELAQTELPIANTYLEKFLNSKPEPIVPLKAYTIGWQARVEMFLGNQAESERLTEEAKKLDPYYSRATGIPTLLLFDPPDQISHHYFSFFSPY